MTEAMPTPSKADLEAWATELGYARTFRTLAELLPEAAVFVVDSERAIRYWSPGAERLLGYSAAEVIGRHCLHSNRCQTCIRGCGIAERGAVVNVPLVLHREDGSTVAVRKTARAFFDSAGRFRGGIELLLPDAEALRPAALPSGLSAHGIVSRDAAVLRAFEILRNVANSDVAVLIRGESGTGKELFAHALHKESPRRDGPFLAVNCAAISPGLLESEMFGHAKGAFTGALNDHPGLFSRAHQGTLFLDEVAELTPDLQAKLLRVLQDKTFHPVGGTKPVSVDVRIVSATHRSLRELARQGRFREDLMYRLQVVPVFLPALRERQADIELLLWHFIAQRNGSGRRVVRKVHPDAIAALMAYAWPGNVRELQNVLDYTYAVGRGEEIRREDLPAELQAPGETAAPQEGYAGGSPASVRYRSSGGGGERERITDALTRSHGHIGRAAALMGMSRPTLWRKRKQYGL